MVLVFLPEFPVLWLHCAQASNWRGANERCIAIGRRPQNCIEICGQCKTNLNSIARLGKQVVDRGGGGKLRGQEGGSESGRRRLGKRERQLCFQLICSELHLALHWQIGCFGPPRSSRIRRRIFGGRGRRRRALGGILVNQRVAEVPTPSSQHPAPSTRRPR